MSVDAVVRFEHARRSFKGVVAVDDLNLEVPARKVTVLLGPNGAGKTTALRMITGALLTEAGTVRVHGLDPRKDGDEVRRNIGVVSAKPALYDRLSGWDNLRYAAEIWNLGPNAPIEAAAKRFGIGGALDNRVGGYSTGMKTRLALARSILHDPELLLLDEPTSGLDPESSQAVLQLIGELAAGGKAVVMCTHLLLEAEGLADHVVLLQDGRDVVSGPPQELVRRYWPVPEVVVDAEDRDALHRVLTGADGAPPPGVAGVSVAARGGFTVEIDRADRTPQLVQALVATGLRVTKVAPHDPSLEELYLAVRRSGGWAPAADLPEVRI
jgi:ABC-2 type transport system ATP-binding protein